MQIGCGLETTYYRNDNGQTLWYDVDLPYVIDYRKELLPENEREKYISGDAFSKKWIEKIRMEYPDEPLMFVVTRTEGLNETLTK